MSFKEIYQFITALKQDLILEELLVEEYGGVLSDILSEKEALAAFSPEESEEISQIALTLKNDSIRHMESIVNLTETITKEGLKIFKSTK